VAPPSENVAKSICTMLINDSSISIEFTENKITVTVEISVTYLNKSSIWPALKATTPFVDASVNKRLRQFGDRREPIVDSPDSSPDCLVATHLAQ